MLKLNNLKYKGYNLPDEFLWFVEDKLGWDTLECIATGGGFDYISRHFKKDDEEYGVRIIVYPLDSNDTGQVSVRDTVSSFTIEGYFDSPSILDKVWDTLGLHNWNDSGSETGSFSFGVDPDHLYNAEVVIRENFGTLTSVRAYDVDGEEIDDDDYIYAPHPLNLDSHCDLMAFTNEDWENGHFRRFTTVKQALTHLHTMTGRDEPLGWEVLS